MQRTRSSSNYVADVAASGSDHRRQLTSTLSWLRSGTWMRRKTVAEALAAQIAVIGENMKIRRFQQVKEENGFVASYIHAGGKIGVLVDVETDVVNDEVKEMAKNVAMQASSSETAVHQQTTRSIRRLYRSMRKRSFWLRSRTIRKSLPEAGEGYRGHDQRPYQQRAERDLPA